LLASLAITLLKYLLNPIAACPFPVPQSQARSFRGVIADKNLKSESGYVGLEKEYSFD
jgi:hypothetical protein